MCKATSLLALAFLTRGGRGDLSGSGPPASRGSQACVDWTSLTCPSRSSHTVDLSVQGLLYPENHCACRIGLFRAGTFLSGSHKKLVIFIYCLQFMAASILPPAHLEKKGKKSTPIFSKCLYSRSVCFREGGRDGCIFIVWKRILSGGAAGKIMAAPGTVFCDKVSSGKLQL